MKAKETAILLPETAERLAIRDLVEAYACCGDQNDVEGQMSLFTTDAQFVVYVDAKSFALSSELHKRDALAQVFGELNKYHQTMHFVGPTTISFLAQNHATGQTECLAHRLTVDSRRRRLLIATFCYLDAFVKIDGVWLFKGRRLYVDTGRRHLAQCPAMEKDLWDRGVEVTFPVFPLL